MTKVALLTSWTILKIKFQYQDSLLPSFSCEKRHQLQDSEKVFMLLSNNLVMMQKYIYLSNRNKLTLPKFKLRMQLTLTPPNEISLLVFISSLTYSNRHKLLFNSTKFLNCVNDLCAITGVTPRPSVILAECMLNDLR